jgi:hypothetical protein
MRKQIILANIFVLFLLLIASSIYYVFLNKKTIPDKSGELIGGQKDSHGCLVGAGYSWCEAKQKCLRTWEEKCEVDSEVIPNNRITYTDEKYKFQLEMPLSWEGYRANSGDYPTYSYTGFSFGGQRQPFEIFKIVSFNNEQWDTVPNKSLFTVLHQADNQIYACDGCCANVDDASGGGQFDEFQVERCKEVPEILKSFKVLN